MALATPNVHSGQYVWKGSPSSCKYMVGYLGYKADRQEAEGPEKNEIFCFFWDHASEKTK